MAGPFGYQRELEFAHLRNGLIVILVQVRAKEKDSAGDTQRLGIRAEWAHWMEQAHQTVPFAGHTKTARG